MTPGQPSLGDLFLQVSREVRARWKASLEPLELAPHHARALRVIGVDGPLRPGVLAARLGVTPRSATDVVDALTERGLVTRDADPDDRRASLVALTADGRTALEAVQRSRRHGADAYFASLDEADRETLRRILTDLTTDRD